MTAAAAIDGLLASLDALQASGASLPALLEAGIRGLHESDDRFDWTGIYELGPDGVLHLGAYQGEATEHTEIPVGRGICGTAVAEKRDLNIPDVREVGNYLACSLKTRSELVVLIRDGETIFAQIDIDSHQVNAFDADATRAVERLAAWFARAYVAARAVRP
ncbi:MAG TPA: GAF domain-containing protein [Candidatus Eisenbacteria bacterium]|nr:GAF domain-containing protein [Candidatus Eisenbacteria bacterium]